MLCQPDISVFVSEYGVKFRVFNGMAALCMPVIDTPLTPHAASETSHTASKHRSRQ